MHISLSVPNNHQNPHSILWLFFPLAIISLLIFVPFQVLLVVVSHSFLRSFFLFTELFPLTMVNISSNRNQAIQGHLFGPQEILSTTTFGGLPLYSRTDSLSHLWVFPEHQN